LLRMRLAIIMAGGSGERFWPVSRRAYPKQLLRLTDNDSLLSKSLERASHLVGADRVYIVTNQGLQKAISDEFPSLRPEQVIGEPLAKNTSACLALALARAMKVDPDPTLAVLTADHIINPSQAFYSNVNTAFEIAERKAALVIFGIPPWEPNTGYGYMEIGDEVASKAGGRVFRVRSFKEKPDLETAKEYLASGRFFWNSGMFCWKASTLLKAFHEYCPVFGKGTEAMRKCLGSKNEATTIKGVFEGFPSLPIDVAVMEKASNVYCVRADFQWDDIGTWTSLERSQRRDEQGNVAVGDVTSLDSHGCILWQDKARSAPRVVSFGVHDLVIVATPEAVLVCPKSLAQDVKKVVKHLKEKGLDDLT
ncbi:MAG: sugar phosphate nucleotidyltransferase, partial [bacterium]